MSKPTDSALPESKEVVEQLLADMLDADKREKALFELVARKDNIPNIVSLKQSKHAAAQRADTKNAAQRRLM